ncbi:MAG: hypothetical protein Q8Q18_02880, partial [bacterium]|nr:hypothetical protein [bacterium]
EALEGWEGNYAREDEICGDFGAVVLANRSWSRAFSEDAVERVPAVGHDEVVNSSGRRWEVRILLRLAHKAGALEVISYRYGGENSLAVRYRKGVSVPAAPQKGAHAEPSEDALLALKRRLEGRE